VQDAFAQASKKPLDLSKTLGFVMGQRFNLNRIKVEYPVLSLKVQKAELEFESTFGIAEKNIKKSLRGLLKDKYPEFILTIEKQLESALKTQQITRDIAVQFLDEVESRAKREIPSPMLETLLNYQFEERPADEFARGFKKIYRTKGHRKTKGLDLQIEYAKSWSKREGNRPHVIQFFSSNNGRGPAHALLMTRDHVKEAQGELTREDIKALNTLDGSKKLASEVFSENSLRQMANETGMANVRNINTKRIVIDHWPGAMLEFTGDGQRLDLTMTMYNRMYTAIYKNYMIFLQCQIGKLPGETDDALKTRISQFAPLFRLMANSLVTQSQY
jgi:hypothetical protein